MNLAKYYYNFFFSGVPLLECCRVDDTSPENTIVGLPPSWVDTDVWFPTVHRHQYPSSRWYAGALEVSSSLLVIGATHWQLDGDLAWNLNVPRGQRSGALLF